MNTITNTPELRWEVCPRERGHSERVWIATSCWLLEGEHTHTNKTNCWHCILLASCSCLVRHWQQLSFAQKTNLEKLNCCSKSHDFSFCFHALQTSFQRLMDSKSIEVTECNGRCYGLNVCVHLWSVCWNQKVPMWHLEMGPLGGNLPRGQETSSSLLSFLCLLSPLHCGDAVRWSSVTREAFTRHRVHGICNQGDIPQVTVQGTVTRYGGNGICDQGDLPKARGLQHL